MMSDEQNSNGTEKPKRPRYSVNPFTPWQIMVYDRAAELNLTTRALASKIASPRRKFAHPTIWHWLRTPNGTPPLKTYTTDLNQRLALALNLDPDVLSAAYDESRTKFGNSAAVASQRGPLSVLRTLFANTPKRTYKAEEIVKLIDDISGK